MRLACDSHPKFLILGVDRKDISFARAQLKATGRPTGAATDTEAAEREGEVPDEAAFTPAPLAMLLPASC